MGLAGGGLRGRPRLRPPPIARARDFGARRRGCPRANPRSGDDGGGVSPANRWVVPGWAAAHVLRARGRGAGHAAWARRAAERRSDPTAGVAGPAPPPPPPHETARVDFHTLHSQIVHWVQAYAPLLCKIWSKRHKD
eukprot:scaffold7227_cov399-Prasinococcus_capsulatus_cf.AAC.5